MTPSRSVSSGFRKLAAVLEALDHAFSANPLHDQALRLASIELRLDVLERNSALAQSLSPNPQGSSDQ